MPTIDEAAPPIGLLLKKGSTLSITKVLLNIPPYNYMI